MIPGIAPVICRLAFGGGIATYYGTGAGEIPLHLDPSDPSSLTIDGDGFITRSNNKGGAGAIYDAVQYASDLTFEYDAVRGLYKPNGVAGRKMMLSTAIDLFGCHWLLVYNYGDRNVSALASSDNKARFSTGFVYRTRSKPRFLGTDSTGAAKPVAEMTSEVTYPEKTLAIAEGRFQAGKGSLMINGDLLLDEVATDAVAASIDLLGTVYSGGTLEVQGPFVVVRTASGYSASEPEPAVLAARAELADIYGIAVS